MSQWKFNDFETDIDFTDADFMEKFEDAYEVLEKDFNDIPKVGKVSERIRAQCGAYDKFFASVFGTESIRKMFLGKKSVEMRIEACNSLYDLRVKEDKRHKEILNKYKPNRQQKRQQEKNKRKNRG